MRMPQAGLVDESINPTFLGTGLMGLQLLSFYRLRLFLQLAGLLWLRKRNRMNEYGYDAKDQAQNKKAASPNH
jgi:hypothetical protein